MTAALALQPVDLPLENGAPIILLPADPNTVHLPAIREPGHGTGQPVTLEEHLAAGGSPLAWRALCGARGHVFVFALMFAHRKICARCEAATGKEMPASNTPSCSRPEQQKDSANSASPVTRKEREVV